MKAIKKAGFTVAELLVVVGIIVVLVAIAIPVFQKVLEKAREATDMSNLRSAYSDVGSRLLSGERIGKGTYAYISGNLYNGIGKGSDGQGKGTAIDGGTKSSNPSIIYDSAVDVASQYILVEIMDDGNFNVRFGSVGESGGSGESGSTDTPKGYHPTEYGDGVFSDGSTLFVIDPETDQRVNVTVEDDGFGGYLFRAEDDTLYDEYGNPVD